MAGGEFGVAVVGCGVMGLACGIRLLEQGFEATILARELPPQTTSDVAGAFWAPGSLMGYGRVRAWSEASYEALKLLAAQPESGVRMTRLVELFDEPVEGGFTLGPVKDVRTVEPGRFPAQIRGGYTLTVPAVDPPVYMPFLVEQFRAKGGLIEQRTIEDLAELRGRFRLVVNCSGVWAGRLVGDPEVYPIRGQVVRVRKPAGLEPEILHYNTATTTTYIIPRSGDCLLGGTYEDNNWALEPDPATAEAIIERCAWLNPALREPEIIEHRVGLRPGRWRVRLELERVSEQQAIIHNYGHGSIGHTLAWGCAAEAAALAVEFRDRG